MDELNESAVAQLGRVWGDHPEVMDPEEVMDMFLLLPRASPEPHELFPKSCSRQLAALVRMRICVLAGHADPAVPYIPWLPQGKNSVRPCLPTNSWFPPLSRCRPTPPAFPT